MLNIFFNYLKNTKLLPAFLFLLALCFGKSENLHSMPSQETAPLENGAAVTYAYDADSLQKIGEFTGTDSTTFQRRFFEYDGLKRIITILIDNGSSQAIHDNQDVTEKYAIHFSYGTAADDQPESMEEKTLDPASGLFITTQRITYSYDPEGRLLTKHLFNQEDALLSSLYFTYDSLGRLVKEIDDTGTGIEKFYDSEGTLVVELIMQDHNFLRENHYIYDTEGQLLAIESVDRNGETVSQLVEMTNHEATMEGTDKPKTIYNSLSQGLSNFWKKTKEVATSFMAALNSFKEKVSYSNYAQDDWHHVAEQVFDKGYLQFAGYYSYPIDSGSTPYGEEVSDKIRITLINGILNVRYDLDTVLKVFSDSHGEMPIHYVFRPTEGWTKDLLTSTLSKFGYTSPYAKLLAQKWKSMIQDMGGVGQGGKIIHYAHSIGATDTYVAKNLLTAEERQMIHVITLGSPTMIPQDSGFGSATNYVSKRDGVCLLDPIGYAMGYFFGSSKIEWIGSLWGIPLIDHTLYTDSYGGVIQELGIEFIGKYQ